MLMLYHSCLLTLPSGCSGLGPWLFQNSKNWGGFTKETGWFISHLGSQWTHELNVAQSCRTVWCGPAFVYQRHTHSYAGNKRQCRGVYGERSPWDYTRAEPCVRLQSNIPPNKVFLPNYGRRGMVEGRREGGQYKEAPFQPPVTCVRGAHQQVNPEFNKASTNVLFRRTLWNFKKKAQTI